MAPSSGDRYPLCFSQCDGQHPGKGGVCWEGAGQKKSPDWLGSSSVPGLPLPGGPVGVKVPSSP